MFSVVALSRRWCGLGRKWDNVERTGPSPKSFSGFWYDMLLAVAWMVGWWRIKISKGYDFANHDLNSWVR